MTQFFNKDPNSTVDFAVDWTDWLTGGETIAVSAWAVDDAPDASLTIGTTSNSTTKATAWLSGGMEGLSYKVRNRITTSAGRIEDTTLVIRIASS